MKSVDITEKMVLGTAQFGMDYGIANISGKPLKKEVFSILDLAWEKGVRRFDTAPGYGSEAILGEFISANNLRNETIMLTKISSLAGVSDYKTVIRTSLDSSLKNLGCPIEVLFFHNSPDSVLLQKDPQFFEKLLQEYPVSTLGVSVYEPQEIENFSDCRFELASQFPFNVLDRRFEDVNIPNGRRYARSIFLQGLLASPYGLRPDAPIELLNLQKKFHKRLADHHLDPVCFTVSFVSRNDAMDYFLIGVDSAEQLKDIIDLELYDQKDIAILARLQVKTAEKWLDPRTWN